MNGWMGKILRVNLTSGKISTEDLNPDQHSCVNIYFSLDCQKQREIYVKILLFLYQ